MNCEGFHLAEGFLDSLFPCFDIVFAQLGVITRTTNKCVKTVATSERYLIINSRIKEAAVPSWRYYLPVKLADGRTPIKKRTKFFYLIYTIVSLTKITGKKNLFQ